MISFMIRNFEGAAYARFLFLLTLCVCFFFASGERVQAATLIKPANTLGLLGWWRFDDGSGNVALDSSGNNNTGSLYEMDETDWTTGVFGTALQFDNSVMAEHVVVSHSSSLSPTAAVTVLGWAKPITYGSGGAATFVEKAYGTSYILYLESSLQGLIFNVNGVDCMSNSTIITLSTWQHIAATYDGTTVRFYVDGTERGTCNNVGSVGTDTSDVKIGNDDTLTTAFDGYIDDVRVYSRALSRNEILQIMRGDRIAKASVTPEVTGALATNLTGWWTFDGREVNWATGRVTDKSGQGNTGYVVNMSTTSAPVDGSLGQAFYFDGSNDLVSIADQSYFGSNTNRTVSFWMNAATNTLFYSRIIAQASDGSNSWEIIQGHAGSAASNALVFLNEVSGTPVTVNTPVGSIQPNNLYHVAVIFNGTTATAAYINGVSQVLTSNSFTSTHSVGFFIGNRGDGTRPFLGMIDDVRMYSRALSASEIYKLYTSGQVTQNVSFSGGNNLESGLIGWWTMDGPDVNWGTGKVTDKSNSGNDGYVVNMSTTTSVESGKIGQALLFDGVADYIDIGNPASLQLTSSVTVSAWVKADTIAGPMEIISKQGGASDRGWQLKINSDGTGRLEIADTATTLVYRSTSATLVPGRWYHLVGVYNASAQTLTMYVDGEINNGTLSGTVPVAQVDSSTNIYIGKKPTNVDYFKGIIDDVRVYDRALSASEARQLYDGRR